MGMIIIKANKFYRNNYIHQDDLFHQGDKLSYLLESHQGGKIH